MTTDAQDTQSNSDTHADLRRGEARAGNPAKVLLLAVGIAALGTPVADTLVLRR